MICIDLGSNTIRICFMNEEFEILKSYEKVVGSARNMTEVGLSNKAMERISLAIKEANTIFDFNSHKCVAVATEAFRIAKNSPLFFEEIYKKFGIKFNIISGIKEAKFTKLGVENRAKKLGISLCKALILDIGGASSEVSFANEFKSFNIGIIKFFEKCCKSDVDNFDDFKNFYFKDSSKIISNKIVDIDKKADESTLEIRKFISKFKFNKIIMTSGIPTTIAAIKLGLNHYRYEPNLINGTRLNKVDVNCAIVEIFNSLNPEELVGKNRVGLVVAGIYLLNSILKDLNSDMIVIDDGLREGIGIASSLNLL